MKQIFKVALVIMGGVICTRSAVAQTKAIEVNAEGNMRFFGGSTLGTNSADIRFGDNQEWGVEYYNYGLNFYKPNQSNGDGKLFINDAGNVGIGTLFPTYKLDVEGNIRCKSATSSSYLVYSDERLKEDIKSIESSRSKLERLHGVSYVYKKGFPSASLETKDLKKRRIGFLAQDLQQIFPDLVSEVDSGGTLAIDYIGLIPVLVEALKEQQSQITALTVKEQSNAQLMLRMEQLEKQLAQCCPANTAPGKGKLKSSSTEAEAETASASPAASAGIVLYQNSPNPFSTSTDISMELPKDVQDAQLTVYNLAGEQRLSIAVTDRGATTVRIEAGQLKPGIYIYGIIADGQLAVSKQMVVTE